MGGTFVIGVDHIEDADTDYPNPIFDKTYLEVKNALMRGDYVTIRIGDWNTEQVLQIVGYIDAPSETRSWEVLTSGDFSLYACSENGYLRGRDCDK